MNVDATKEAKKYNFTLSDWKILNNVAAEMWDSSASDGVRNEEEEVQQQQSIMVKLCFPPSPTNN